MKQPTLSRLRKPIVGVSVGVSVAVGLSACGLIRLSPCMASAGSTLRVAVLGGGVAGCSAAARLRKLGAQVTLVEMGRGVGGRTATRRSRDDKRFEVDHGAPVAEIATQEGATMAKDLEEKGFIELFTKPVGRLRAGAAGLHFEEPAGGVLRYCGRPNLGRLCEGLLDGAGVTSRLGAMARALDTIRNDDGKVVGWKLIDKDQTVLEECDWLVVSGSGVAHPRWTAAFGGDPPLLEAASKLSDPKLSTALRIIGEMGSRPVQTMFAGFEGDAAEAWSSLPFGIAEIEGDEVIAKFNIQQRNGMVFVVAHSTHSFAESAKDAFGSTSTAARVGGAAAEKDREQEVLAELVKGMQRCVAGLPANVSLEAAIFGPILHRWGNAFPDGASLTLEEAVAPGSRVAFVGDFVGQRSGSIEGAMLSGSAVAELLMSESKL